MDILWIYQAILWIYYGYTMDILWLYHGYTGGYVNVYQRVFLGAFWNQVQLRLGALAVLLATLAAARMWSKCGKWDDIGMKIWKMWKNVGKCGKM